MALLSLSKLKSLRRKPETGSPSTTVFFAACMRPHIGEPGDSNFPIWQIAPNAFYVHGDKPQALVVRSWSKATRAKLNRLGFDELHYILDDDIWSGAKEKSLPPAYRLRLQKLIKGPVRQIFEHKPKVYVTSNHLAGVMEAHNPSVVGASLIYNVDIPNANVPPPPHLKEGRLRIIYAASRSHMSGLRAVADELATFLKRHPQCHLDTLVGEHAPKELDLPNVTHHKTKAWSDYQEFLKASSYDIGILPAQVTAFNEARSPNKILELACLGVAPVVSENAVIAHLLREADAGIVCADQPGCWIDALEDLLAYPEKIQAYAAANAKLAYDIGSPAIMREFWEKALGIQPGR